MKQLTILAAALMLVFGFYSCTNTTSNTSSSGSSKYSSYFPTSIGSYWVYQVIPIDSNGVQHPLSATYDSVVVSGPVTKNDTTGVVFTTYSFDSTGATLTGTSQTDYYFANDEIFQFSSLSNIGNLPIPVDSTLIPIPQNWALMIDFDASPGMLWQVFSFQIDSLPLMSGVQLNGTVNITGKPSTDKNLNVGTVSVDCKSFIITPDMEGNVSVTGYPVTIHASDIMPVTYYLANNIGFVSDVTNASSLVTTIMTLKNGGQIRNLMRYHIK